MASFRSECSKRVIWFALWSRIIVIILQVVFNCIIPDHNAHVFQAPGQDDVKVSDHGLSFILGGFRQWDAQYFLHIAANGYSYENTLAFFPLLPLLINVITVILFPLLSYILSFHSCLLLVGVMLNITLFVISALILYKLSFAVLKSELISFITALLFCLNPASIFFSAVYSEALFSCLTFYGLWLLELGEHYLALIPLGLSSCVRSNGIISAGFVIHSETKFLLYQLMNMEEEENYKILKVSVIGITNIILKFLACLLPFFIYQFYAYLVFCIPDSMPHEWPVAILKYAETQDYKVPGDESIEWCSWILPLSYSYVQNHYWSVGFLRYYEPKQIPNFLLALPLIILIAYSSVKFFRNNKKQFLTLGLIYHSVTFRKDIYENKNCFVYFVHASMLTVFCALFIHVQVTTRLLASSSPLLYWVVASLICKRHTLSSLKSTFNPRESESSVLHDINFLYNLIMTSSVYAKLASLYFCGYFIVGTLMYVNSLPWT